MNNQNSTCGQSAAMTIDPNSVHINKNLPERPKILPGELFEGMLVISFSGWQKTENSTRVYLQGLSEAFVGKLKVLKDNRVACCLAQYVTYEGETSKEIKNRLTIYETNDQTIDNLYKFV